MFKKLKDISITIWKDPVWSKVLSFLIIALISVIPIKVFWETILAFLMMSFSLLRAKWYIFTILLELIIIIYLLVKNRKPYKKENGIEWLRNQKENDKKKIAFLFWYPINGTKISPSLNYSINNILKLRHSKVITDLINHNILEFQINSSYKISDIAYDYFESRVIDLKNDPETLEGLRYIKNSKFEDIIWECIFSNVIDL